ncbi:hypothetical protein [Embleya sp. NPDC005971]|uniref:hypothetical protein n=1 Tax=unclassified Embleya TaxID=2699296 RepID=UPI0033C7D2C5
MTHHLPQTLARDGHTDIETIRLAPTDDWRVGTPTRPRLWELLGRPRPTPFAQGHYRWRDVNERFDPHNANALRGLAWLLSFLPARADTAAALAALVDVSLVHVQGTGPRNPKVANAGVTALSRIGDHAARTELRALADRVAFKSTLTQIHNASATPS